MLQKNIDLLGSHLQTSQADFELLGNAQENSKLSASIVQSPEKLQVLCYPIFNTTMFLCRSHVSSFHVSVSYKVINVLFSNIA